jgi:hypothetical protein
VYLEKIYKEEVSRTSYKIGYKISKVFVLLFPGKRKKIIEKLYLSFSSLFLPFFLSYQFPYTFTRDIFFFAAWSYKDYIFANDRM